MPIMCCFLYTAHRSLVWHMQCVAFHLHAHIFNAPCPLYGEWCAKCAQPLCIGTYPFNVTHCIWGMHTHTHISAHTRTLKHTFAINFMPNHNRTTYKIIYWKQKINTRIHRRKHDQQIHKKKKWHDLPMYWRWRVYFTPYTYRFLCVGCVYSVYTLKVLTRT